MDMGRSTTLRRWFPPRTFDDRRMVRSVHGVRPMALTSFSGLSSRLTLLVLLAFLPAFGLVANGYVESQRQLATQVETAALQVAHRASTDHEQLIAVTHGLLVTLARVPEVRQSDLGACSMFLADVNAQHPFVSNLLVARPDGEVTCTAVPLPGPGPVNIADREHFQRALATRDFAIGQYLIGRIQRAPTFPIAYPIIGTDGRVQSIVIATLSLEWLSHLAATADLPEGARLTVFDRAGSILA